MGEPLYELSGTSTLIHFLAMRGRKGNDSCALLCNRHVVGRE